MIRRKPLIFENRSAAYMGVCEQRIGENQRFTTIIVDSEDRFLKAEHLFICYSLLQWHQVEP